MENTNGTQDVHVAGDNVEVADDTSKNQIQDGAPPATMAPVPPKVKREYYQTQSDLVVSMLAKNLKKEEVTVEFGADTVHVKAKLADGSDYDEVINLYQSINASVCSYKVLSTKIEIKLRKLDASTWPALEAAAAKPTDDLCPSYPTSSKNKKDWGKVEKEIEKEIPEDENVNNLFAKIFASGDENTQRAMMKSMQESGGTVLSTNWEEVGKKKTKVSPPDGMEWKKWDDSTAKKQ